MTLLGSLPAVRNRAVEVATSPIARMPTKSKRARKALAPAKVNQIDLSLEVINRRLDFTDASIVPF
jgi:hypothetical protein